MWQRQLESMVKKQQECQCSYYAVAVTVKVAGNEAGEIAGLGEGIAHGTFQMTVTLSQIERY